MPKSTEPWYSLKQSGWGAGVEIEELPPPTVPARRSIRTVHWQPGMPGYENRGLFGYGALSYTQYASLNDLATVRATFVPASPAMAPTAPPSPFEEIAVTPRRAARVEHVITEEN
jgi:hypothetical protein